MEETFNKVKTYVKDKFEEHPKKNGMTYVEHLCQALRYCGLSLLATVIFLIHAVFPFILETNGSDIVHGLDEEFEKRHEVLIDEKEREAEQEEEEEKLEEEQD